MDQRRGKIPTTVTVGFQSLLPGPSRNVPGTLEPWNLGSLTAGQSNRFQRHSKNVAKHNLQCIQDIPKLCKTMQVMINGIYQTSPSISKRHY